MRPTYIVDSHDSLAALLGTTIEDPLLRHTFPTSYTLNEVKQEPFDYVDYTVHHPSIHEYSPYTTSNTNYATMMPMTTVASTQPLVTSTSSSEQINSYNLYRIFFVSAASGRSTEATRSSPILPVCPLPTEKTVDQFYNSTLAEMCKSLPDETLIVRHIKTVKATCKPDSNAFAINVAEENLKELVTWAKNNEYFSKMDVSDLGVPCYCNITIAPIRVFHRSSLFYPHFLTRWIDWPLPADQRAVRPPISCTNKHLSSYCFLHRCPIM